MSRYFMMHNTVSRKFDSTARAVLALTLGMSTTLLYPMQQPAPTGAAQQAEPAIPPVPDPQDPEEIATVAANKRLEDAVRAITLTHSVNPQQTTSRNTPINLAAVELPKDHPGLSVIQALVKLADVNRATIAKLRTRQQPHQSGWPLDIVEQHGFLIHMGLEARVPHMDDFIRLVSDNLEKFALTRHDWQHLMEARGGPGNRQTLATMLHWASMQEDQSVLELLLSLGATVNCRDNYGYTPLHNPANAAIAHMLVTRGAQFSTQNGRGSHPLHSTSRRDVIQYYVHELHHNVDMRNARGNTPLHCAVIRGFPEQVKGLLAAGANPRLATRDAARPSTAHLAISTGLNVHAILTELLKKGIDVNAPDANGDTLLHYLARSACQEPQSSSGHENQWLMDVATLLLQHGANPRLKNLSMQTAWQLIPGTTIRQVQLSSMLRSTGAQASFTQELGSRFPVALAAARPAPIIIPGPTQAPAPRLIARAPCASAAQAVMQPPSSAPRSWAGFPSLAPMIAPPVPPKPPQQKLFDAISARNVQGVRAALADGARADRPDSFGEPPLHHATRVNNADIIRILLEAGAQIEQMFDNRTALDVAIEADAPEALRALLAHGANPQAADIDEGSTYLHAAATNGLAKIASILLEFHATVDALTRDGQTPLHWAAENGYAATVEVLLAASADPDGTRTDGWTPLRAATEATNQCFKKGRAKMRAQNMREMKEVVLLLLRRGATVTQDIIDAAHPELKQILEIFAMGAAAGRQSASEPGPATSGTNPVRIKQEPHEDITSPGPLGATPLHAAVAAQPAAILAAAVAAQAKRSRPPTKQEAGPVQAAKRARATPAQLSIAHPETQAAPAAAVAGTSQRPGSVIEEVVLASGFVPLQPGITPAITTPPQPQAPSGAAALLVRFAQRDRARFSGAQQ